MIGHQKGLTLERRKRWTASQAFNIHNQWFTVRKTDLLILILLPIWNVNSHWILDECFQPGSKRVQPSCWLYKSIIFPLIILINSRNRRWASGLNNTETTLIHSYLLTCADIISPEGILFKISQLSNCQIYLPSFKKKFPPLFLNR